MNDEEVAFRDILVLQVIRGENSGKLKEYAMQAESVRRDLEGQARSNDAALAVSIGQGARGGRIEALSVVRETHEARAERDLWSLLDILTRSNLIRDLNHEECEESLVQGLSVLTVRSGVADVINAAYQSDDRIKKGGILLEWLEAAAVDKIVIVPETRGSPWGETLSAILREKKNRGGDRGQRSALAVLSVHPDAQLDPQCLVLPLKGSDCDQQESFLKCLFQLLRCGKMKDAQEYCVQNKNYWLAASLLGSSNPFYEYMEGQREGDGENTSPAVSKKGNVNRSAWMHTCWKYADQIEKNPGNHIANNKSTSFHPGFEVQGTLSGVLEMTVYATLSCNLRVLSKSPLLHTFSDHLWAVVKAAHERDILSVLHDHKKKKASYSGRFPGCGERLLAVEGELLKDVSQAVGQVTLGACEGLFERASSGVRGRDGGDRGLGGSYKYGDSVAESILLQLTSLIMEGRSGLKTFIDTVFTDILQNTSEQRFPGISRVLRVFCHLALWIRSTHTVDHGGVEGVEGAEPSDLSELMSEDLLQLAVESYAQHLITEKKRTLIAAYCAHLTPPRRIALYSRLVLSMANELPNVLTQENEENMSGMGGIGGMGGLGGGSALTLYESKGASRGNITRGSSSEMTEVVRLALTVMGESELEEVLKTTLGAIRSGDSDVRCQLLSLTVPPLEPFRLSYRHNDRGAGLGIGGEPSPISSSYSDALTERDAPSDQGPRNKGWRRDHAAGWGKKPKVGPSAPPKQVLLGDVRTYNMPAYSSQENGRDKTSVCVDSLQLLLLDPMHACLAVMEANRLLTGILLDDPYNNQSTPGSVSPSFSCLRKVLRTLLPSDIVQRGWECLELKVGRISAIALEDCEPWNERREDTDGDGDDVASQMLLSISQAAEEQIACLTSQWNADVSYLMLWESYLDALEAEREFALEMRKQQCAADRMLGGPEKLCASLSRFRPAILKAATQATDSILSTLLCNNTERNIDQISDFQSENDVESPGGIRDVFRGMSGALSLGFSSSAQTALRCVRDLGMTADRQDSEVVVLSSEEDPEFDEKHRTYSTVRVAIEQCVSALSPLTVEDMLRGVLPEGEEGINYGGSAYRDMKASATSASAAALLSAIDAGNMRTGTEAIKESIRILRNVGVAMRSPSPSSSAVLSHVELEARGDTAVMSALSDCSSSCTYVADLDRVASVMGCGLLTRYLEVVMSTASFLLTALNDCVAAHAWLAKGAQLSDLIASEDLSLQLFRLLSRDDLASLLHKINNCCINMMQIYPVFTVENLDNFIDRNH